ncbi:hypothetical protein [Limosilactobacillus oris]|uniref:hypothetical protein n=1 Tax=Limosilactobacillus oris TaxID=1632 RepID=UPI00388F5214
MAKTIYRWDASMYLTATDSVADDYTLRPNETTTAPDKIEKSTVKWEGAGWRQLTDEEDVAYIKAHLGPAPISSQPADDKGTEALGALGKQVGQLVIDNQKNTKAVQALGAQLASFIAKDNTNGGK